jgi:plastocyanin
LDNVEILSIDIRGNHYLRETYAGQTGQGVVVTNHDTVMHTVHLYDGGDTVKNVALPAFGSVELGRQLSSGKYRIGCDLHTNETVELLITDGTTVRGSEVE